MSYTKHMVYLTLSELASLIKTLIQSSLYDDYWVIAEIAQINFHFNSGHCYLDLVEKKEDIILAKMKATIWSYNFNQITVKFKALTGQNLQAGMKILMLVQVTYHGVHGLSLNIKEIDPRYTLGEMMLKRREIIERLTKEGILKKNKLLELPPVIQRIAVISAEGAAGYGDFQSRLNNNPYGYRFNYKLFQAYMQGEKAEQSVITALEKCIKQRKHFDAIVIIRGGGSVIDLHCFDSYSLAKTIALSPLPVFTGIGHEKDETVADHVANKRLITPTAVAEFLITKSKDFEEKIDELQHRLKIKVNDFMEREKHYLRTSADIFFVSTLNYMKNIKVSLQNNIYDLQATALSALRAPSISIKEYEGNLRNVTEMLIMNSYQKIKDFMKVLNIYPSHIFSIQKQKLENYENRIRLLNPQNILKRGYSITYLKGRALRDTATVIKNDIINTRLSSGFIISIVEDIERETKDERKKEDDLFSSY